MNKEISKNLRSNNSGFDLIRRRMNSVFDDFFNVNPTTLFSSEWVPLIDIAEDSRAVHIKADLPGMTDKDISVTLEDTHITISGEKNEEQKEEGKDKNYIITERRFGSFRRSVSIPYGIDRSNITAEFKNGVLSLTLPKDEKTAPKKIEVK